MMTYTSFGEFMKIQRIKHRETMADTANLFEVSSSFISMVESGKKNIPASWIDKINEHYQLSDQEKEQLMKVVDESRTQFKISTVHCNPIQRKAAYLFSKHFKDLDEKTAQAIIDLLQS